ncbi:chemotaxis protein CheB [Panacibacter sp. DH6]|uniref:protein-glutamate methylesterase n=1 Tax=Panacibacter microcysteis TaxID=2793269 RepID=A0A931E8P3_9BACT|nr:chemotaxis protein CheB [Panacibacter microcysteis]MBG9375766.1 chemotaxis protein CheB [Panacibacter microcysteis]
MTRTFKLIVIGGSAGSLQVILKFFKHLKHDFPVSFMLVLHRNNNFDSSLEELLGFRTNLTVKEVEEKEPVMPGFVYVCPADYHVLIEDDFTFSLDYSEKINYSRPSIDVVFMSAADVFGRGLLCILLSGANADGAEGLKYAQARGALIVVQEPADADVPYMPQQALLLLTPDLVLKAKDMAPFVNSLV